MTTPERTWIAFNWLTHSISPDALFQRFKAVATDALDRAINHFNVEADRFAKLTGNRNDTNHKGRILTTAELCEEVRKVGGNAALERIAALETELSASDNPLLITRELVDRMVAEARITGPTVIIGFGSLVYPHVHMATETDEESRFAETLETARLDAERRFDTTIRYREIFAGISDMSFFGHVPDAMDSEVIAANTPAAQFIDCANPKALSYPVVNIGPWGREYHQRLERVYAPYAFTVLPQFLYDIADRFLRS